MKNSMPPVHPAAELFPMMTDGELKALADDIKANGLQQPVVLYGAQLLDGRNRWRACEMAGVEVKVKDWAGKDAVAYVRSLNLHRRHLSSAQRAALAVKAEPVYAEAAAEKKKSALKKGNKQEARKVGNRPNGKQDNAARALAQAAKETGASLDSAKAMKQVAKAAPEIVEMVQRGQVETVTEAKRLASLPSDKRAEATALVSAGLSAKEAIDSVKSIDSVFAKATTLLEAITKKASSLSNSCMQLAELMEANGGAMSGPQIALIKAKAYQIRATVTSVIENIEGEKDNV